MVPRPGRRFLFTVAALVAFSTVVAAQSGRRSASKPSAPPSSSAPPESTSTNPTESATKKAPEIQMLVGVDDPNALSGIPQHFADTVLDVCVHRLSQPAGVKVTAGPRTLSRGDAVKAAKAETARYVVWLQVGNSSSDTGRQVRGSSDEYYVNFMLLEPGSAKVKQSGRVMGGGRRVGNVGVGVPSSRNVLYLEEVIRDAARQAAERILSALGIKDTEWPRGLARGQKSDIRSQNQRTQLTSDL
jgi:hypothetical protein